MLELHLRSGTVVAFDGRVVEVFGEHEPSRRFHVAQLGVPETAEAPGGGRTVTLENGTAELSFAAEEAPACTRFLAAIANARAALER
jgi:hypothetical protein